MTAPIHIRPATAAEVINLRHVVLRAGLPRSTAVFAGDEDPAARHFVAVAEEGAIVGCVTLHPSAFEGEPAWQLRGMAVAPALQGMGIGKLLLAAVERSVAADLLPRPLWCNARVPASGFYQNHGWIIVSDIFDVPSAGPHVRMMRPLSVR